MKTILDKIKNKTNVTYLTTEQNVRIARNATKRMKDFLRLDKKRQAASFIASRLVILNS